MASVDADAPAPTPLAPRSPVRRYLPWALLVVVVVGALSVAAFGTRHAPTAQDRVTSISRTVKCPTCQGESAAESNAPAAQAIRAEIARLVQEGETDEQIRTSFAGRYDDILLTPPTTGVSLLVWVLPVVALAVAVAGLAIAFRRWSRHPVDRATAADSALVADALRREREQVAADDDPHGEGVSR